MTSKELIKLLEQVGWIEDKQKGSHRIFKYPDKDDNISVPEHGKKDLGIGLLNAIMKKAGIK